MIYTDKIHLVADTLQELHSFAEQIGLNKCWFGGVRKKHPHYDVVNRNYEPLYDKDGKKFMDKAIEHGAQLVRDRKILEVAKKLYEEHKLYTSKKLSGIEADLFSEYIDNSSPQTPTLKGRT